MVVVVAETFGMKPGFISSTRKIRITNIPVESLRAERRPGELPLQPEERKEPLMLPLLIKVQIHWEFKMIPLLVRLGNSGGLGSQVEEWLVPSDEVAKLSVGKRVRVSLDLVEE